MSVAVRPQFREIKSALTAYAMTERYTPTPSKTVLFMIPIQNHSAVPHTEA